MSIIQDIQNRALDEGRIKAENVNSYKVLSVRPSAQLSAIIEVLAFLDGKSPSEFICSNFSKALHDFTLMSKDHVEPLQKSVAQSLKSSPKHILKKESAIGMLEEEGVVTVKSNDNNDPIDGSLRLLKHGFNDSGVLKK